jgi:crossover junction endodeoxyribonuclease RuvC
MRILGIDPGSETTGWAVIEGTASKYRLVDYGTLRASSKERFAARLLKISNGLETLIEKYAPDAFAIEEAFFAVNAKSALKLGQVRGVALLSAERAGLEIGEYSPRLIKQTVVGYGNAEKHQVQEMVRILLSLPATPQPHDAADAIAIAICHLHHAGTRARLLAAEAGIKSTERSRRPSSKKAMPKPD